MSLSSLNSIGQTVFKLESGNGQTNRRNYTNFERKLAMMVIYLPVKFEFHWANRFRVESGNKNVDGQTDVGHINLIGRLVTHNPPKKVFGKKNMQH